MARRDLAGLVAGSGWADLDGWDPGPPSAVVMAEQEAILAEHIAAGLLDEPAGDELSRWLADPDSGPPEDDDAGLGELAAPVGEAVLDAAAAGPGLEGPFPAGVIMHDQAGPGGPGFASGSVLDRLAAGPALAAAADAAWQGGLGGLPDDELAGLMLAWRRCESRAAAGLLAGTAELARRRAGHGDWRVLEHLDSELALLFTLTRRSAGALAGFADSLARLPATAAALAAGRIDRRDGAGEGSADGVLACGPGQHQRFAYTRRPRAGQQREPSVSPGQHQRFAYTGWPATRSPGVASALPPDSAQVPAAGRRDREPRRRLAGLHVLTYLRWQATSPRSW